VEAPLIAAPAGGAPGSAAAARAGARPGRLARIRWRCPPRPLLENDIILARFLDARADGLDDATVAMLDRLLDLPDNDLWDLIAGRVEPDDASVRPAARRAACAVRATTTTTPTEENPGPRAVRACP
jgi:antitoxin CptB